MSDSRNGARRGTATTGMSQFSSDVAQGMGCLRFTRYCRAHGLDLGRLTDRQLDDIAGAAAAHGALAKGESVPIFEVLQGAILIPRLPIAADGSVRVADGEMIIDIHEAAERYGVMPGRLREAYISFCEDVVQSPGPARPRRRPEMRHV
jgi:hypothetical protein